MNHTELDDIYKHIPLDKIPWNIETPPEVLFNLVKEGIVTPCKTIDLGCGIGNYALYFAKHGFDVTGIDYSVEAINLAIQNAKQSNVNVDFRVADMLGDVSQLNNTFSFAYDWEVLHHIYPKQRSQYITNVYQLLNDG